MLIDYRHINSDNIFVIDSGKVVAEGKHQQLIENSNLYKNFYENKYRNKYVLFYQIIISFLTIISPIIIIFRIIKNKEDSKRFIEKFSFPTLKEKKEN